MDFAMYTLNSGIYDIIQENPWKGEKHMVNLSELEDYFYVMGMDLLTRFEGAKH